MLFVDVELYRLAVLRQLTHHGTAAYVAHAGSPPVFLECTSNKILYYYRYILLLCACICAHYGEHIHQKQKSVSIVVYVATSTAISAKYGGFVLNLHDTP